MIMLMMSALAAFLILWYFWVKRRLAGSCFLDDEQRILFPFKYFSWVLLGVVFVTCVAQVHFVRVSAGLHESLAARTCTSNRLQVDQSRFDELKEMLRSVRGDMNSGFKRIVARSEDRIKPLVSDRAKSLHASPSPKTAKIASAVTLPSAARAKGPIGFGKAAGTYSAPAPKAPSATPKAEAKSKKEKREAKVWSMNLDLTGQVTADVLRVRERPEGTAPVVERLKAGSVVRVKEKRFVDDSLWFKIESPSELSGWVDFRYLKLLTSAKPVTH
jgi:hypothetical protein